MSLKSNSHPSDSSQPPSLNSKSSSTPPSPPAVIGPAWTLATKYPSMTIAAFLVQLPLTYALSQVPEENALEISFRAHSLYEMLIAGFLTYGVYRCALAAVRHGAPCSFRRVFSEGSDCWGRNFRLSWVLGLCMTGVLMAVGLPVVLLYVLSESFLGKATAVFTTSVVALFGLVWALRVVMRLSLSAAWLADKDNEVRTSSQAAIQKSWSMTKGRSLGPLYGAFWMSALGYIMLMLLGFCTYYVIGTQSDGYISYETAAWADIALSLPGAFVSVWTSCMFAMAYLRYSAPTANTAS